MGIISNFSQRLFDRILVNFNRTSIELEKKAKILLISDIAAIGFMTLLLGITLTISDIEPYQIILFVILDSLALAIYFFVLFLLSRGSYKFASQLFLIANMVLGYLASFIRADGEFGDLYWAIAITAILCFIATLLAVHLFQVVQISIVGFIVVIIHFALLPQESLWTKNLDYLLVAIVFTTFLGFLSVLLYHLTNESIEIAQKESNNVSVKLSKLKLFSGELPKEYEKLDKLIDGYTGKSIQSTKEIISRLNGLDMAIKEITNFVDGVHRSNPDIYKNHKKHMQTLLVDDRQLYTSLDIIKDLNFSLLEISVDMQKLKEANEMYMEKYKEQLSKF